MPNSALTDLSIKRLPLPESGTTTHWDSTCKGLGVRVSPKGTRTFIVLMGSGQRHKLGRYPALSLKTAREEAAKLLAKKTLGTFEKANTILFETAVERYLAACTEKNRPSTVAGYTRHLAYFPFKGRRLAIIKKSDVAGALEKIAAQGERSHALVSVKVFFSWCAGQGLIDASPISALKTAPQRQHKLRRALSEPELKEVLSVALRHPYPFGHIVALLVLTGQRRNEMGSLEWARITPKTITIAAEVSKNHIEHTFPYGTLVREVLDRVPGYAKQSPYVFPAGRTHVRGKSTTTFNGWSKAKAGFDTKLKAVAPFRLHDLRRTFATTLQRLGVSLEVREKLLNHISGTQAGVAGVYNVYAYEAEMREAINQLDAYLTKLLENG